jgi:hypothetical protein
MRTLAQKQSQPQKETPARRAVSKAAPAGPRQHAPPVRPLQRIIGNQDLQRVLETDADELAAESATTVSPRVADDVSRIPVHANARMIIQPKLTVNLPGDIYEQEADRIAEQVMRMPEPQLQHACACGGTCPKCHEKKKNPVQPTLYRTPSLNSVPLTAQPLMHERSISVGDAHSMAEIEADRIAQNFVAGSEHQAARRQISTHGPETGALFAPPIVNDVLRQNGTPLSVELRREVEPHFGCSFADVRIHTDERAATSARVVNANAYTVGSNIVFGRSAYNLSTHKGRYTLVHELTHVAQSQPNTLRRQGDGSTTSVELCFVPINRFHLAQVGGVHVVLNVHGTQGIVHAEVNPAQHSGIEDPAAVAEGAGRAIGLHSHVVISPGVRHEGSCQTLTATPAEADAVIAAARRYESMDVVYEPPGVGPNSNSFGEWALHEAGINTSSVALPDGALGWGWYQSHPSDRSSPPRVARTFQGTAANCTTPRARATSFNALIDLIRDAESQLISCGITDVGERINVLRGIYYGTPWSRDFGTSQQSHIRNQMFNIYSGAAQPRNPIECMDCGTFLAIGASQDTVDPRSGRRVDVGHLLIGMDARRSWMARNIAQPVGQVTGLEAATWAGDLGGGAARLAMRRVSSGSVRATEYFRGTDYGGSINLEGDVAAYAVAAGSLSQGDAPTLSIPSGSTIADSLDAYFNGTSSTPAGWNSRCRTFLTAVGSAFDSSGALTNRSTVLAYLTEQIHDFGCWYMVNFQRQHRSMHAAALETASRHMAGASAEIAEVFLSALERCNTNPAQALAASGTAPSPSPAGDPSCLLARTVPEGAELIDEARELVEQEVIPEAEQLIERAEDIIERADSWIEQRQREAQRWWRNF